MRGTFKAVVALLGMTIVMFLGGAGTGTPSAAQAAATLQYTLRVTVDPYGGGRIASTPGTINCTTSCTGNFDAGTAVTLKAYASTGWKFVSWGNDCAGQTSATCVVNLNAGGKSPIARFEQLTVVPPPPPPASQYTLRVSADPWNAGRIESSPGSINCKTACTGNFNAGTAVTLKAYAEPGWKFVSWGNDCAGQTSATCVVNMNAGKDPVARFQQLVSTTPTPTTPTPTTPTPTTPTPTTPTPTTPTPTTPTPTTPTPTGQFALRVSVDPSNGGRIESTPGSINCKTACAGNFNAGTAVTLRAYAEPGWKFVSWGNDCAGQPSATCVVNMNAVGKDPVARFQQLTVTPPPPTSQFALRVSVDPSNGGRIESTPGSINCKTACTGNFNAGTAVTLKAYAEPGWKFVSWGNDCAGQTSAKCVVNVNVNGKDPIARFQRLNDASVAEPDDPPDPYGPVGSRAEINARATRSQPYYWATYCTTMRECFTLLSIPKSIKLYNEIDWVSPPSFSDAQSMCLEYGFLPPRSGWSVATCAAKIVMGMATDAEFKTRLRNASVRPPLGGNRDCFGYRMYKSWLGVWKIDLRDSLGIRQGSAFVWDYGSVFRSKPNAYPHLFCSINGWVQFYYP